MNFDFEDFEEILEEDFGPEEAPDWATEQVTAQLKEHFNEHPGAVFFMKQLSVKYEDQFFHWVTGRATRLLIEDGFLNDHTELLADNVRARFVFKRTHRYYRTQVKQIIKVIREYSNHDIAFGCGRQAEMLFLDGLRDKGFQCIGKEINEYSGRKWAKTAHDLDYIIQRDGVVYGCEVKNTLDYINSKELSIKLDICDHLRIKPLFIMRFAPKTYNNEIIERGGFALLFKMQIYPFGQRKLVERIREVLELPVDCPRAIPEGIIRRFLNWHERNL